MRIGYMSLANRRKRRNFLRLWHREMIKKAVIKAETTTRARRHKGSQFFFNLEQHTHTEYCSVERNSIFCVYTSMTLLQRCSASHTRLVQNRLRQQQRWWQMYREKFEKYRIELIKKDKRRNKEYVGRAKRTYTNVLLRCNAAALFLLFLWYWKSGDRFLPRFLLIC